MRANLLKPHDSRRNTAAIGRRNPRPVGGRLVFTGRAAVTFRKRVLRSTILSAAFLTLAASAPASAQYWGPGVPPPDYSGRIPPQHVEAMVRSMGYQPVAEPRTRGPLWVTHAIDRDGQQVRVLIDSFSGRVIDVLRRPLPPQRVAVVPPPNLPPQANGPMSDYEDDGPDYDYRNAPQRRPADWPPARPNAQQQGPQVIPWDQRGDNRAPNAPKANTAKKKETKDKKKEAALTPEKEKEKMPCRNRVPPTLRKPKRQRLTCRSLQRPRPSCRMRISGRPVRSRRRCSRWRRTRTSNRLLSLPFSRRSDETKRASRGRPFRFSDCRSCYAALDTVASITLASPFALPSGICRGFLASGMRRTRSTWSRPFSTLAPVTST